MDAAAPTAAPAAPPTGSRRGTVAWLVCSALLVALVVGVWMRVGSDRAGANLANAIIKGDRPVAPALPTERLADVRTAKLPAAGSRVLVVNWWASWCGPCIDEAPVLRDVAEDYDGKVTVVGLNAGSQDLAHDARAFVREHELDGLAVVRGDRADEDAWGVTKGFPETFVVGTDGRISSYVNGPVDSETLRGLLDDELGKDRTS